MNFVLIKEVVAEGSVQLIDRIFLMVVREK